MSVFNGDKHLKRALKSVLNQTYKDIEYVIVDNGSTDKTNEILTEALDTDSRLKLFRINHTSLSAALNFGLKQSTGEYIARMDADDVSLKNRIKKQVNFLDKHNSIDVVGSFSRKIGKTLPSTINLPVMPEEIHASMIFKNPIIHPASMYRKSSVMKVGGYSELLPYNQDYDLWSRVCNKNNFFNISSNLILYRVHSEQTGLTTKVNDIYLANIEIMSRYLDQLNIIYDEKKLRLHYDICSIKYSSFENNFDLSVIYEIENWLNLILLNNNQYKVFDNNSLEIIVSEVWSNVCISFSHFGHKVWMLYKNSDLYLHNKKWNDFNIFFHSTFKLGINYRKKMHSYLNNF